MNSNYTKPVNLGNPTEYTIEMLARVIKEMTGNEQSLVNLEKLEDDPRRRRPDITVAKRELNWQPITDLHTGLRKTIDYFHNELKKNQNGKKKTYDENLNKHRMFYLTQSDENELFDSQQQKESSEMNFKNEL
jgi:UDP-glucuronate decarboxylase